MIEYRNTIRTGTAALLLALTLGCGSSSTTQTERTVSTVTNSDGTTVHTANGITVRMDESVKFQHTTQSGTGVTTATTQSVNGQNFSLDRQVLTIGDLEIQLADGDKVRLSSEGIFVNDERRAEMPSE